MKALKYTVASFFTFFLVLVLIVACISGGKSKTEEVDFEGGNTRDLFVAKAIDEYNAVNGVVGGDKYRKWYTGSADGANWCATFVSWIADQCGLIDAKVIPKYQGCDAGVDWFKKKSEFQYTPRYGGKSIVPSPGDIIFFCKGNKNDSTHTGIVIDVTDNTVHTIEGNSSNTVKRNSYKTDSKSILGYGIPAFPNSISSGVSGMLSEEFKYFAKYESSCNYDQGFSSSDDYHALGYYQFDNRYDLQKFLKYCYQSDNNKYACFEAYLSCSKASLRNNKGLEKAWHTAYSNDPKDFANKQDQFEYDNYYIPIENALKSLGIDLSSRRDCIKGLVCGMANLFGNSGAKRLIKNSGVTNDLGDKEFVTKLCDYLVSYCPKHYAYGKSYANRYKNEKNDCLRYISN